MTYALNVASTLFLTITLILCNLDSKSNLLTIAKLYRPAGGEWGSPAALEELQLSTIGAPAPSEA